jgi:hypothetical protein
VFKVVLEILIKVALTAVSNEQPIHLHLARSCIRVKMLQPLKTKRIISPAILRN